MVDFVYNGILWTLALYGLIEIFKNIYYICTYTRLKTNGINVIVTVKDEEESIEYFMRTFLFRMFYANEEYIKNIIITDLGSKDKTPEILSNFQKDYNFVKLLKWKECKELIDNINKN